MADSSTTLITGGTHIHGGSVTVNVEGASQTHKGRALLLKAHITSAQHDSGEVSDQPRCHEGTRQEILSALCAWCETPSKDSSFQWVYGPAGAGKSAIMRTVADMLAARTACILLATFFFSRTSQSPGRNSTLKLVPTLAYQIGCALPTVRPYIERAVEFDPTIFERSLEVQFTRLIVEPINAAAQAESSSFNGRPAVIILDGLDECDSERQRGDLLRLLSRLVDDVSSSLQLTFLIASRPEVDIRGHFNSSNLSSRTTRLSLEATPASRQDVRKFLMDHFERIALQHPHLKDADGRWPPKATVKILEDKSSGYFVFPSTVIRFLDSRRHDPEARLKIILGAIKLSKVKTRPFQELDDLYSAILERCIEEEVRDEVLTIIALCCIPWDKWPTDLKHRRTALELVLGHPVTLVKTWLVDLDCLLKFNWNDSQCPHSYHASLGDFIFDKIRAGAFFVDPSALSTSLTVRSLKAFADPSLVYSAFTFTRKSFFQQAPQATLSEELEDAVSNFAIPEGGLPQLRQQLDHDMFWDGVLLPLLNLLRSKSPPSIHYKTLCIRLQPHVERYLVECSKAKKNTEPMMVIMTADPTLTSLQTHTRDCLAMHGIPPTPDQCTRCRCTSSPLIPFPFTLMRQLLRDVACRIHIHPDFAQVSQAASRRYVGMACALFAVDLCQRKSSAGPEPSPPNTAIQCLGFLLHHADVYLPLVRLLEARLEKKKYPFSGDEDEDDCSVEEAKEYLRRCEEAAQRKQSATPPLPPPVDQVVEESPHLIETPDDTAPASSQYRPTPPATPSPEHAKTTRPRDSYYLLGLVILVISIFLYHNQRKTDNIQ